MMGIANGKQLKQTKASAALEGFSVLTFNVWFEQLEWEHRADVLFKLVQLHDPTFVCFQEVTPKFKAYLVNSPIMKKYVMDAENIGSYGVMIGYDSDILSHGEFSELKLKSSMGRTLKSIEIGIGNTNINIGTVHLESLSSRRRRRQQLQDIEAFYRRKENVIFCGDFNFDSEQNFIPDDGMPLENLHLQEVVPDYTDIWEALRDDRGLTFDTATNPWIMRKVRKEKMRYDRIVIKSPIWEAHEVEVIGNNPTQFHEETESLEDPLPSVPSDHYGLVAKFRKRACEEN